jgi:hypothetical protein
MSVEVVAQELVVHVFFPLDGPRVASGYQQVRQLWTACQRLGMTESIPGIAASASLPDSPAVPRADVIAAAQRGPGGDRQAVLRRVHDVLNLSVGLAQRLPHGAGTPDGQPPGSARPVGWAEQGQLWLQQASAPGPGTALGEARLYLGRLRAGGTDAIAATPALGRSLEPLLPYREDRARDWWRRGTTTSAGYALWDLSPGDTDRVREIIVIAPAGREHELSAWAWSDGTTDLPRFARYLMHAAKLRYQARLLDTWEDDHREGDLGEMLAELDATLAPDVHDPDRAGMLRSRLSRLRKQENRLKDLGDDLERMGYTVGIALDNLRGAAGPDAGPDASGLFAADQALGRWLAQQLDDHLSYLRIDIAQTSRARESTAVELDRPGPAGFPPRAPGATGADVTRRRVFVVYGRDAELTEHFFELLRAVDLQPMEWEQLVAATGPCSPSRAGHSRPAQRRRHRRASLRSSPRRRHGTRTRPRRPGSPERAVRARTGPDGLPGPDRHRRGRENEAAERPGGPERDPFRRLVPGDREGAQPAEGGRLCRRQLRDGLDGPRPVRRPAGFRARSWQPPDRLVTSGRRRPDRVCYLTGI